MPVKMPAFMSWTVALVVFLALSCAAPIAAQEAAPGPAVPLIEHIRFEGNTRVQEAVLRRGLTFSEGDGLDEQKVARGSLYLVNLRYFKAVSWKVDPGSGAGLVDVVYTVEPDTTLGVTFGVLFVGGDFPLDGAFAADEIDLAGAGLAAGFRLAVSPVAQSVSAHFANPWISGRPLDGRISLTFDRAVESSVPQDLLAPVFSDAQADIAAPDPYASRSDWLADLAAGTAIPSSYLMTCDLYTLSLVAETGYTFTLPSAYLRVSGAIAPAVRRIVYDAGLYRPFDVNLRRPWGFTDRVAVGIALDGRDIYLHPTRGYRASQAVAFAGGPLLGEQAYIRTDSTLEGYLPVVDVPLPDARRFRVVLAARSAVSLVLPTFAPDPGSGTWGWRTAISEADAVSIDGTTVGRGWPQRYGGALWASTLEVRVPIDERTVWVVGFLDAAGLWDQLAGDTPASAMSRMTIGDFAFSAGLGLRLSARWLPMRLCVALPFRVTDDDGTPRITLGTSISLVASQALDGF